MLTPRPDPIPGGDDARQVLAALDDCATAVRRLVTDPDDLTAWSVLCGWAAMGEGYARAAARNGVLIAGPDEAPFSDTLTTLNATHPLIGIVVVLARLWTSPALVEGGWSLLRTLASMESGNAENRALARKPPQEGTPS